MTILPMLPLLLGLSPATADGVSRAMAQEAALDARFDVVSELDVLDLVDFEAARQACGGESEACDGDLGRASDARFVVSSRAFVFGEHLFLAVTLFDLQTATAHYRGEVQVTGATLLERAKHEVRAALRTVPATGEPVTGRLLVRRLAIDEDGGRRARIVERLTAVRAEEAAETPWDVAVTGVTVVAIIGAFASFAAVETSMPDNDDELALKLRDQLGLELVPSAIALGATATVALAGMWLRETRQEAAQARTVRRENLEAALEELGAEGGVP